MPSLVKPEPSRRIAWQGDLGGVNVRVWIVEGRGAAIEVEQDGQWSSGFEDIQVQWAEVLLAHIWTAGVVAGRGAAKCVKCLR